MRERGRTLLKALLILIVSSAVVLGAGCLLAFHTEAGRRAVAGKLSAAIGAGIAGDLTIGRFSELGLSRARAHDVTIRAPDGKPAIEVEQVTLTFSLAELLRGVYGWERAEIDGCLVHVLEDAQGKVNMEQTFKSQTPEPPEPKQDEPKDGDEIDMRSMVTSRCVLVIGGGSLPSLRLVDLAGVMRVHVAKDGKVDLRFDDYRGTIVKGLPTGELAFEKVEGKVQTQQKQLLAFSGQGRSEGAAVRFQLAIATKPEKRVKIDAKFPGLSLGAARAKLVAAYTRFSDSIEFEVDTTP